MQHGDICGTCRYHLANPGDEILDCLVLKAHPYLCNMIGQWLQPEN